MSANAPQPRTLEVSLVWAREAMAMTPYTNVVLYVLFVINKKWHADAHRMLSWGLGPQYKNPYFQKSKPFMRLSRRSGINFRWHDFSEALKCNRYTLEPNELPPVAAGGEGIGKRINNTFARAERSRFPQTRVLWKRASMGQCVGRVSSRTVSR